jgi:chromosome partitioning protein
MKIVSAICQKGGTSKTTLVLNLAVEASAYGLEVVVIDFDPQVSACDWKDIRGDRPPVVAATPIPHLQRTLKAAADNGTDLVVIDSAGRTNAAATAAARAADLVLIPLQPSLIDLQTLGATLDIVRLAGNKPARAVLSRVKAFGTRHQDTAVWLAEKGVDVCPVMLGDRIAFQDAYARGLAVVETEPHSQAAEEIRQVYLYLSPLLGSPMEIAHDEENRGTGRRVA